MLYKGMAPAVNNLISGQIAVGFVNITPQVVALHRLAPWVDVGLGTFECAHELVDLHWDEMGSRAQECFTIARVDAPKGAIVLNQGLGSDPRQRHNLRDRQAVRSGPRCSPPSGTNQGAKFVRRRIGPPTHQPTIRGGS